MKKILLATLLAISSTLLHSQVFHPLEAPVTRNGQALQNPWAGGLNAPQWSEADLNNDGKLDLYLFDRVGFVHLPFINVGEAGESKYEHAPHLATNFPPVFNFGLLRDFDHDGAADYFASSNDEGLPGLKVYKGRYLDGQLIFDKLLFNGSSPFIPAAGDPDPNFDYLFVNQYDLPAIDDVDSDGDLDVVALDPSFFTARYYENVAKEMGYTDDTLIFEMRDDCWGKFHIFPEIEHLILSNNKDSCSLMFRGPDEVEERGGGGLHGGGTISLYDADNDGDKDLFYGDLTYESIIFGLNGGDEEQAWIIDQDTTFPSYNIPVEIEDFAASFFLDADNDGLKDLMVSPNRDIASPDYEVGWFYKNTQSNEEPVFTLQQKDFLVGGMIDLGSGARPAIADVNGDGLLDIVVGNFSYWQTIVGNKDTRLFLLLNTGTANEPAFELVDDNWLNFKQYASTLRYDFAPTFGDMDLDGDLDLLVGEHEGKLFYAENTAGAGAPMTFGPVQYPWMGIDVGVHSTPFIHDLNKDGLPDLIIGERNGNINFLPNFGTPQSPMFEPTAGSAPNNPLLGNIVVSGLTAVTGYSTPVILEIADSMYLVSGSEVGWLEFYRINPDSLQSGTFDLIDRELGGKYEGNQTAVAFGYLNEDDFLDAVIGNFRGGLGLFTSPIKNDGTVSAKEVVPAISALLFPNPTTATLHLRLGNTRQPNSAYRIFNAMGQMVQQGDFLEPATDLDVSGLGSGFYFVEIVNGNARLVERFVKK